MKYEILIFNYLKGEYEWAAYQSSDSVGTQETWIFSNGNPSFIVSSEGEISGDTTYELVAFPVEFQITDQTASLDSIYVKLGSSDFILPWMVR